MGFGIEARYARCKRYWEPHLALCKEFVRTSDDSRSESLCVLGAGRLNDLDWDYTKARFSAVHLVDCDPSCEAVWSRFRAAMQPRIVTSHLCEVSTVVERWTNELRQFVAQRVRPDLTALAAFFVGREAPSCACRDLGIPAASTVYSLNLLSQIPIYVRDRWISILADAVPWALRPDGQIVQDLEVPMQRALGALQIQHLRLLSTSGARTIFLISDRSFLYYRKENSAWQEEPALFFAQPPVLEGYRQVRSDSWFWHIAPQGLENDEYGSIHDVVALQFDAVGAR